MINFMGWIKHSFQSMVAFGPFAQRERWTRDITSLMALVILVAAILISAGILVGFFQLWETIPIYILLVLIAIAWWGARHGGWRWASYVPALLCFTLGVRGSYVSGFDTVSVVFYAMSILLAGMLQKKWMGFGMVLVSTITYTGLGFRHEDFSYSGLAQPITFFFSMLGISVLQWYTYSHLQNALDGQIEGNRSLKAEMARRQQVEAQLRRLANNMTDLVAEIDPNGIFRYASPSYRTGLGYTPESLLGSNAFDIVHPDDLQAALDTAQKAGANQSVERVQLRVRHADGQFVYYEVSGKPIYEDSGSLDGFVLNSRDISIQKEAENAIQASEKKFRDIIECFPMGIHMYTLQVDGSLVFSGYNPAADSILGIDHALLLNQPIQLAFPGLVDTDVPNQYHEIALHGGNWNQVQVDYSYQPVEGAFEVHAFQTSLGEMVAVFSDIAERIRASEALRTSEEKFATAFMTSPDSININRLEDGVFLDINQGFTRLMGYTREEVMGRSSLELNIWADPADRAHLVAGLKERGEVNNLEAKFQRKNGEIGIGLMSARVIHIHGENCILSITRDVTERIQAELALRDVHAKLALAYEATLLGWARALELRERETADHSRRVVDLTEKMATALGIAGDDLVNIRRGALLHDIGKLGVPDQILLKPGQLTADEWVSMRQHTTFAKSMLSDIDYLRPSIAIPYGHHEKWDGTGYPLGLKGEEIPLPARIFAVVDVVDALTHDRPYRPAWSQEEARRYLLEQKGKHFDPQIVDLFLAISSKSDHP